MHSRIDEAAPELDCDCTYSQEYLQRGMSHFHKLKVHQAPGYRYVSVVLGGPRRRWADGGHPAPGAVLHPPGAMHGQVEGEDKVRVLGRWRESEPEVKLAKRRKDGRRQRPNVKPPFKRILIKAKLFVISGAAR